jgi:hypothetical protein
LDALLEYVALLLLAERRHKLMRVAVQGDLVPLVDDLADLLREGFCGVGWCEPCCFDVVLVKELEEPIDSNGCAEDAARYVGGIGRRAGTCV